MDRKAKRNKEVHTAKVILLAGTQVRDLMTGESFFVPKKTEYFGWYLPEKFQWFYWNLFFTDPSHNEIWHSQDMSQGSNAKENAKDIKNRGV